MSLEEILARAIALHPDRAAEYAAALARLKAYDQKMEVRRNEA